MKIIISTKESKAVSKFLRNIEPNADKKVCDILDRNQLVEVNIMGNEACFEVSEDYILETMNVISNDVKFIAPLIKSIICLASNTCTKLHNAAKKASGEAKDKRNKKARAERRIKLARNMMRDAERTLYGIDDEEDHRIAVTKDSTSN